MTPDAVVQPGHAGVVLVGEVLTSWAGLATRAALIGKTSRASVDKALRHGEIVAVARGRYSPPQVVGAPAVAHRLGALSTHASAPPTPARARARARASPCRRTPAPHTSALRAARGQSPLRRTCRQATSSRHPDKRGSVSHARAPAPCLTTGSRRRRLRACAPACGRRDLRRVADGRPRAGQRHGRRIAALARPDSTRPDRVVSAVRSPDGAWARTPNLARCPRRHMHPARGLSAVPWLRVSCAMSSTAVGSCASSWTAGWSRVEPRSAGTTSTAMLDSAARRPPHRQDRLARQVLEPCRLAERMARILVARAAGPGTKTVWAEGASSG